ncbi:MAG TPA: LemA family protein, partial [Patescibacteria group bacterium]
QAQGMAEKSKAENMLSDTLKSLFAVAENYPDLKATQNFIQLQDELVDTENKIQAARRFYNNNVRLFNTKLQVFPTNMIGRMLGFMAKEYFEVEDEKEREAVRVKF